MAHPLAELARFVRRRAQREGLATTPATSTDPRTALLALRGGAEGGIGITGGSGGDGGKSGAAVVQYAE